jgi:hypothetical protein
MINNIPDIYRYKTMLYIGAKAMDPYPSGVQLIPNFKAIGYTIDVLEIWPSNINDLKKLNLEKNLFRTILQCDIREAPKFSKLTYYDVIVWLHGPEHIKLDEIVETLKAIEQFVGYLIILGMPYGREPGEGYNENIHEKHKGALFPDYFERMGYSTDYYGKPGHSLNNLLAWKRT